MQAAKIHDNISALRWLLGNWKCVNGIINYPTLECPIKFNETLIFSTTGEPLLNFTSIRWNPKNRQPTDLEGGFLKINKDRKSVSLLTSHNMGIATIEEGVLKHNSLFVATRWIGASCFGKDKIIGLTRSFHLNKKGQLIYKIQKATPEIRTLTDSVFAVFDKDIDETATIEYNYR